MSVRCKPANMLNAIKALRNAKMKFSGRQKIMASEKFGFSDVTKKEYSEFKAEGKLIEDGSFFKVIDNHGPLERMRRLLLQAN